MEFTTEHASVIIPLKIGPHIIHYSIPGKTNILEGNCSFQETLPDGRIYSHFGGHHIWHNPEEFPRSYIPDNEPPESYELLKNGIRLKQKQEPWTQIQKAMEVTFEDDGGIRIVNSLTNRNAWPIEMAVWSLTIGSRGGSLVLPIVQKDTGLKTNTGFRYWPYSRLDDPRVHMGQRFVILDNDPDDKTAFKLGYDNEWGWMAFFNHDQMMVMTTGRERNAVYPDQGCNCEAYTTDWGMEYQFLTPLRKVDPGKTIHLEEKWYIFESKGHPGYDESVLAERLRPATEKIGIGLPVDYTRGWDTTSGDGDLNE